MEVSPATIERWKHHLHDEADAAFLYAALAAAETDQRRRDVYRRLADLEQKHVAIWLDMFERHGVGVDRPPPSARARLLVWLARRFGSSLLVSLLLREEAEEVKGYLKLHRQSAPGAGRETAFRLARESAEHAKTLGTLAETEQEPWHRAAAGGFLRNAIYGFNDGLTANFGLVAGVIGADVAPGLVVLTGVAGTIADALSMGASGYLAAKSEREVYSKEIAMERDEILLMPEVEQEELALIYEAKGMDPDRAAALAADVLSDPDKALQEKVREELGIGESHTTPLKEGWITGLTTAIGAAIPVVPFLALPLGPAAAVSFGVSMLAHFGVGAARSIFTGRPMLRSGLDMFVVGFGVAAVGYAVGELIAGWL